MFKFSAFFFSLKYQLFLQISIAINAAPLARSLSVNLLLQFILLLSLDYCFLVFVFLSFLPTVVFGSFSSSRLQFSLKADMDPSQIPSSPLCYAVYGWLFICHTFLLKLSQVCPFKSRIISDMLKYRKKN